MGELKAEDLKVVQELKEILGWHWATCSVEKNNLKRLRI